MSFYQPDNSTLVADFEPDPDLNLTSWGPTGGVEWKPDGSRFFVAGGLSNEDNDGAIYWWGCDSPYEIGSRNNKQSQTYPNNIGFNNFTVRGMKFNPDGTKMYLLFYDGYDSIIRQYTLNPAYDPSSQTLDHSTVIDSDTCRTLEWAPDGSAFWTSNQDGIIKRYDVNSPWNTETVLANPSETYSFPSSSGTYSGSVDSLNFSPDGQWVYLTYLDDDPHLQAHHLSVPFNLGSRSPADFYSLNGHNYSDIAWDQNGGQFYVTYEDKDDSTHRVGQHSVPTEGPVTVAFEDVSLTEGSDASVTLYQDARDDDSGAYTDPDGRVYDHSSTLPLSNAINDYTFTGFNYGTDTTDEYWAEVSFEGDSDASSSVDGDGEISLGTSSDPFLYPVKFEINSRDLLKNSGSNPRWPNQRWELTSQPGVDEEASFSYLIKQPRWIKNGEELMALDWGNNRVVRFSAGSPYSILNLNEIDSFPTQDAPTKALKIHSSGTSVVVGENDSNGNGHYREYLLSSAFDLSTAWYHTEIPLTIHDWTGPIQWHPSGKYFYYIDYHDETGYNSQIRRAEVQGRPFRYDVSNNIAGPSPVSHASGFYIRNDGMRMFLLDWNMNLRSYKPTNGRWDFTDINQIDSLDLTTLSSFPYSYSRGMTWAPDGEHFYVAGNSDGIVQIDLQSDPKLFYVWPDSDSEHSVSYDEIFTASTSQWDGYDHENFSEIGPDPASCWPLDELAGSTAADVADANDLTVDSGVTQGGSAFFNRTKYEFDKNDDAYLHTTDASNLDVSEFTVCFWQFYESSGRDAVLETENSYLQIQVGYVASDGMRVYYDRQGGYSAEIEPYNLTEGNWYFCAVRFDGDTLKASIFDLDGSLLDERSVSTGGSLNTTASKLHIGHSVSIGDDAQTNTNLCELRWYNQSLNQGEIEILVDKVASPEFIPNEATHDRLTTGPDHARTRNHRVDTTTAPDSFWPCHETDGGSARDLIGSNTLSMNEGVNPGVDGIRGGNAFQLLPGYSGAGLQNTNLQNRNNNPIGSGFVDLTFWYYRTSYSSGEILRMYYTNTNDGVSDWFRVHEITDGFELSTDPFSSTAQVTSTDVANSNWYFVAVEWNPTTFSVTGEIAVFDDNGNELDRTNVDFGSGDYRGGEVTRIESDFPGGKICNIRMWDTGQLGQSEQKDIAGQAAGPNRWSSRSIQL